MTIGHPLWPTRTGAAHGIEHRGERLALFGREGAIHYAPMGLLWTGDLIVFTNGGALSPDEQADLERHGVQVHTAPIRRLDSTAGTTSEGREIV